MRAKDDDMRAGRSPRCARAVSAPASAGRGQAGCNQAGRWQSGSGQVERDQAGYRRTGRDQAGRGQAGRGQAGSTRTTVMVIIIAVVTAVMLVVVATGLAYRSGRNEAAGRYGATANGYEGSLTDLIPDEYLAGTPEGGSSRLANRGRAVADDDGELHVGWDDSVSWSFEEERYEQSGIVDSKELVMQVLTDITVDYPQLVDAGEHTDKINAALRDAAMHTVDSYLLKPDDGARQLLARMSENVFSYLYDVVLESDVTWAITYNTEDFVSVSFSDAYTLGYAGNGFIDLRCVNANLKTGEVYAVGDVIELNESIANAFVNAVAANSGEDLDGDGTVSDAECTTIALVGRDAFVQGILGKGDLAHQTDATFFVDEQGRVNLGITYWLSTNGGWVHGWWDVTLTDKLLEGAKKDSSFWALLGK